MSKMNQAADSCSIASYSLIERSALRFSSGEALEDYFTNSNKNNTEHLQTDGKQTDKQKRTNKQTNKQPNTQQQKQLSDPYTI